MRRYSLTVLAVVGFLAWMGAAPPFSPVGGLAEASNRPLATGVTISDAGQQEQLGMNRIRKAGAKFTRVIIYWKFVAPSVKPNSWDPADPTDPHYDWAYYDQQILMAKRAGLRPMVQIYLAPQWAEGCENPTPGICDPDPAEFAKFSAAAAKRYSGDMANLPRVKYWEPWNEPNLFVFFEPQLQAGKKVSPILYRNMLNRFAGAVKGVDPTNKVVAGGLAPLERPGGLGPLDFARRVLCMKGRKNPVPDRGCKGKARFDIWANNPFTTGGPTHKSAGPDDVSLGDLPKMGRLLRAAHSAGRIKTKQKSIPFWVTEFSWDSKPSDPGGVPMKILTRWTSEAMFRSWQAGVTNFFWLTLRDWARPEGVPFSQTIDSGLYFRGETIKQDRPKANLRAFRFPFVAFGKRNGISIWGRTPESTSGRVSISFRKGARWKKIGASKAGRNGVFQSVIKSGLARKLAHRKRDRIRATYRGKNSVAFSLRPVKDYYQPPFGK